MSHTPTNRILVVSSNNDQACYFVKRIKDLSNDWAKLRPFDTQAPSSGSQQTSSDTHSKDIATAGESQSIPWTIVNRYYTADVHFETRNLTDCHGGHVTGVPAVVYVWTRGESMRDQVTSLAKLLEPYTDSVEVSLAVRFSEVDGTSLNTAQVVVTPEDENELDEFLSENGFEFIDGDQVVRDQDNEGGRFDDEDLSGVPGLPRVIDALSTIVWPSLVQTEATRKRKSRARELLDWAKEQEEEDGLKALVSPAQHEDHHQDTATERKDNEVSKKSRMQREMEALERWLEEDYDPISRPKDDEAWKHADWDDMPTTPTILPLHSQEFGFEDDFADFVGAPIEVQYDRNRVAFDSEARVETSYQSLSSFEDNDDHDQSITEGLNLEDDGDENLPTKQEIRETSRKIFGFASPPLLGVPATQSTRLDSPAFFTPTDSPSSRSYDIPFETPDSSFTPDGEGIDDGDGDFDIGAFDLSRVLSALQGMKEEISGIQDEGERRKAAARVALGLVYGLRREEDMDAQRGNTSES